MVKSSRTRHLLLFGLAVALTAHLWMLHTATPTENGGIVQDAVETTATGSFQPAASPPGGEHGADMRFMALTCLAVLMGVAPAPLLGADRERVKSADRLVPCRHPRGVRVLGWPPPVPPCSRVDAGVLLVV